MSRTQPLSPKCHNGANFPTFSTTPLAFFLNYMYALHVLCFQFCKNVRTLYFPQHTVGGLTLTTEDMIGIGVGVGLGAIVILVLVVVAVVVMLWFFRKRRADKYVLNYSTVYSKSVT